MPDKKKSGYELEGKRHATGHAGGLNEALKDLDDFTRLLWEGLTFSTPKEKIKRAFLNANEAFLNRSLNISDRTLAMAVVIAATILKSVLSLPEKVEDIENALVLWKSCLKDLHSM